ncbi:MAG: hydroxymethylbilane synthase [Alphaproteobacteria bacterium]|nr:hydroxymethylbilane synthase [Alphaproteobacteria bacterium]
MKKILRLGTRGSPLALVQAQIVRDELYRVNVGLQQECEIEIVPLRTTGDWIPGNKNLTFLEMGGTKGLFTKEIEEALLNNMIDCAVHSMKDVSIVVPDGLSFAAFLERADPHDALLSPVAPCLADLPAGARIGTSSLRRRAQILAARPDLTVVPLRGNVDTRLKKLACEEADATILAVAGLARLGLLNKIASIFDTKAMLPAAAQGILGIQIRTDDEAVRALVRPANHEASERAAVAERALLRQLDGSCRTPIAAYATITGSEMTLDALVAKPDGSHLMRRQMTGLSEQAEHLGDSLGAAMKEALPFNFFVVDES